MFDFLKSKTQKLGQSPGTLHYVGLRPDFAPSALAVRYGPDGIEEEALDLCALPRSPRDGEKLLLNVLGVHDPELVRGAGRLLGLHPLVMEDVLNTGHRPKIEEHDGVLFMIVKAVWFDPDGDALQEEQISVAVKDSMVAVFQEQERDVLAPILERIRSGRGRIRGHGAGYLLASVLDTVIDSCFVALAAMDNRLEVLEEGILDQATGEMVYSLHALRRSVLMLRNTLWPLRESLGRLVKGETGQVDEDDLPFFRDVQDHVLQALDTVNGLHEILSGLMDMHMSMEGMRMNRVMKVLTVIATVFIPLTFVAGIYGMNFQFMPELSWRYGYFAALGLMAVVGGAMLVYFLRRKWL